MSNDHRPDRDGVPFEAEGPEDAALWEALETLPSEAPPATLRTGFYRTLREREERKNRWFARLLPGLRMAAPAALALVVGFGVGRMTDSGSAATPTAAPAELASLQAEVSRLSRTVALSMLQDDAATERLQAISLVSEFAQEDPNATRALLAAATTDPVAAVRGAALDALGPKLGEPLIEAGIRRLLLEADSVLVQLSVADLIMRWGGDDLIATLVDAAEAGTLLPDVARYVNDRVRRTRA